MKLISRRFWLISAGLLHSTSLGCTADSTAPDPAHDASATIEGTVRHADTREPVPRAEITLKTWVTSPSCTAWDSLCAGGWSRLRSTRTDGSGRYRVELSGSANCSRTARIIVRASDLRSAAVEFRPACGRTTTHDFDLHPKEPVDLAVEGVVTSQADGSPIQGARVKVLREPAWFEILPIFLLSYDTLAVGLTGPTGEFRVDAHVDDCPVDEAATKLLGPWSKTPARLEAEAEAFRARPSESLRCTAETQVVHLSFAR